MLNSLRKMRRNNTNTKYLKYAIGEIFLVVIGIFLAVQINNWNEERKQDKIISKLVELLKADLNEDLAGLILLDSTYSRIDKKTDQLFDQFKTIQPVKESSNVYFINLLLETNFKSQQNAYDILKESGQFSSLPIDLQNELMHYYSTVEEIVERERISNSFIQAKYEPMIFGRYASFFSRSNAAPPLQEVYYNDPRPTDAQVVYDMFKDKELEVLILARRFQNNKQWEQYKLGIEEIERIIPLLENY